ncbi:putative serine/threonine-protein kinase PBL28 [Bidens hawaiensis]|uniref:putative serine/threonine-protein kinase PBL28 n=1 Tax=Bidens hawaiensis TaxID=980011 RepID=UPI004049BEB5
MSVIKEFKHLKIGLRAIKSATNNFDDRNYIGKGGFGKVYKGELVHSEVQTMVAVKRLDRVYGQGDLEFWKEIMMLSLYKHENIIALLGFCDENGEKIIVYKYASNRSLDLYLSSADLTWIQRLKLCVGAARGLEYLHNPKETHHRILHRDIKSSNILLDENWKAKISDFGLSKLGPANQQHTFLVSQAVGTVGYCDPLYAEMGFLTKESDVYSFGVVLHEVLCGRLCISNCKDECQPLVGLARQSFEQNKLNEIIFDQIKEQINPDSLKVFASIAYRCLKRDREERPTMTHIVKELEIALEMQLAPDYNVGKMLHGCEHYKRRCKLRAPCCNQLFSCRSCHDKCASSLNDPNERHKMVLKDVKQVVCLICNTKQQVSHICSNCGVKMGEYFCAICKLYDDDTSKQQFHCYDCGVCRLHGRKNYYHCQNCGCCLSVELRGFHVCSENAIKRDCPVCHEYLFESIKPLTDMYCGHAVHSDCYSVMMGKNQPLCPKCSKSSFYRQMLETLFIILLILMAVTY